MLSLSKPYTRTTNFTILKRKFSQRHGKSLDFNVLAKLPKFLRKIWKVGKRVIFKAKMKNDAWIYQQQIVRVPAKRKEDRGHGNLKKGNYPPKCPCTLLNSVSKALGRPELSMACRKIKIKFTTHSSKPLT